MYRIIAAAVFAAAPPLVAMAGVCPTGADLETGITLSRATNGIEIRKTYTSHLGGLHSSTMFLEALEPAKGPYPSWNEHALTMPSDPTGEFGVVYENSVEMLDELNTNRRWSSFAESKHISGASVRFAQYFTYLDSNEFTIGLCSYTVWRIGTLLDGDVAADAELENPTRTPKTIYLYAPELRIVLGEQRILGSSSRYSWVDLNDEITAE